MNLVEYKINKAMKGGTVKEFLLSSECSLGVIKENTRVK